MVSRFEALLAENLFSEISTAGSDAQATAQANLGIVSASNLIGGGSGSSTITTPSLTADPATSLRFICMEWDTLAPYPTTPTGWTLYSPTSWYSPGATVNHCAAFWSVPYGTSGIQTITMSGGTSDPVFLDIQLALPGSTTIKATLITTETWTGGSTNGPPIRTSLLATETWTPGAVAGPPIRVSCLVTETWISTTPMTNKPQLLLM